MAGQSLRGRDDDARRMAILDAALTQLGARGYAGMTMLSVATAARTSKEVVYRLFGDKEGLVTAVVRRQAAVMNARLMEAVGAGDLPPAAVLGRFGRDLLDVLFGDASIAINRAAAAEAMRSPALGRALAGGGREGTRPVVVAYLTACTERGELAAPDPEEAFEVFLGLLLRDRQVGALTAARRAPTARERDALADRAVALFMGLHGPGAAS